MLGGKRIMDAHGCVVTAQMAFCAGVVGFGGRSVRVCGCAGVFGVCCSVVGEGFGVEAWVFGVDGVGEDGELESLFEV